MDRTTTTLFWHSLRHLVIFSGAYALVYGAVYAASGSEDLSALLVGGGFIPFLFGWPYGCMRFWGSQRAPSTPEGVSRAVREFWMLSCVFVLGGIAFLLAALILRPSSWTWNVVLLVWGSGSSLALALIFGAAARDLGRRELV